ncbi:EAL domain-containing protein [Endozoicomonas sp. SM1973]|uniref:cyclic-guanylate-specific phosphodiesterase n=1 Tax=Spartinivicinus marinus TaxID=2994442 RepID=A0A853I4L6_9GAMM|nr:EAL domain-containing protein [Spartinivicinus marinus]MCX4029510.1 EAL domain-containing protein [Spartinivicinus marinus]NYZ65084.1 EAL domain-containing protein [Spartinivicinus marinus]
MPKSRLHLGIRGKLISIFSLIKVLPLLLLAWIAWDHSVNLGHKVVDESQQMADRMLHTVATVGEVTTAQSVKALDAQAQAAIERLTVDTAEQVAQFLYERDKDLLLLAGQPPDPDTYQQFIAHRTAVVTLHQPWQMDDEGKQWQPVRPVSIKYQQVTPRVEDNRTAFHYRPPDHLGIKENRPLYREISFFDVNGQQQIRILSDPNQAAPLLDVSRAENTWYKAERYFAKLNSLQKGDIYVSDVIGAYVPSPIIGPFTRAKAKQKGISFLPENAGYAGKENPVGKRFEGIVRWITPVFQAGEKIGYLSLALDHTHIMEFTDHLVPTQQRFTPISDASSGNYAFMWDYLGRNISHPRDYFIVGYDPTTGEQVPTWLDQHTWQQWQDSGLSFQQFITQQSPYKAQSLKRKPALTQVGKGQIALDCRYLHFAPQCSGWWNLTEEGGAGSFVIFWSGLWKISTAAVIPYYTGRYANSARGFGFVTIGANIDQFHAAAMSSKDEMMGMIQQANQQLENKRNSLIAGINTRLQKITVQLTASTAVMVLLVILIAIWIASYLTNRLKDIITGMQTFTSGDLTHRLATTTEDEVGELIDTFNELANTIEQNVTSLNAEIHQRKTAETKLAQAKNELEHRVEERTLELRMSNEQLKKENKERQKAQRQIEHLARYDHLTGLANRVLFGERLKQAIQMSSVTNEALALLFIDLDGFKEVNDSLGHEVGDLLLKHVARCLESAVREGDTVARLGGDEFAVIAGGVASHDVLVEVAERLLKKLLAKACLDGHCLRAGGSIGIACYPADAKSQDKLIHFADMAMYQAKHSGGGNCYRFFTPAMHERVLHHQKIEAELHQAIQQNELRVYYQPKINLQTDEIFGMEALVRWQHPERGLLPPSEFIEIAEHTGQIIELGAWVLAEACRQTNHWHQQGITSLQVSVNVSGYQIDQRFVEHVNEVLTATQLNPQQLELELTESILMNDTPATNVILKQLRDIGVAISIDDFGTGYSSFERIRALHLDVIKVDRSFIKGLGSPDDNAIVDAIISMAKTLKVKILAEGVETKAQREYLQQANCDAAQGYLFSKPLPPELFEQLLTGHKRQ